MITTDPGTQLRRDIAYNTTNFGELGKYIRIEYILNILDRYTIVDINDNPQHSRIKEAQEILSDPTATNEREIIQQLLRVFFT